MSNLEAEKKEKLCNLCPKRIKGIGKHLADFLGGMFVVFRLTMFTAVLK